MKHTKIVDYLKFKFNSASCIFYLLNLCKLPDSTPARYPPLQVSSALWEASHGAMSCQSHSRGRHLCPLSLLPVSTFAEQSSCSPSPFSLLPRIINNFFQCGRT